MRLFVTVTTLLCTAVLASLAASALAKRSYRTAHSTAYCLSGRMADGTYVRRGSVAMNRHRLGTKIYLTGPTFFGRRRFTVRDRIGYGSEMDFWTGSCATARRWGRRTVSYRIGWPRR